VGGAFYPGIECGWIVREPDLYVKPFEFRFRHAANEDDFTGLSPGDVTKRSACPWQADFNDCGDNWWPAQRPNQVRLLANSPAYDQWARKVTTVNGATVGGHMGMVMNWSRLGVVVPGKDPVGNAVNFEDERTL
jgi:hypothetical protein